MLQMVCNELKPTRSLAFLQFCVSYQQTLTLRSIYLQQLISAQLSFLSKGHFSKAYTK